MDLDDPLALDHARVAGVPLLQEGLGERRAVDRPGVLEGPLVVVPRRQPAHLVLDGEHAGRAELAEPADAGVRLLQGLEALGQLAELLRIRRLRRLAPAHDDRLEALGAHHRAHARAAVGAVDHVHDRGEAHAVLARRADLRDLGLRIADLLLEEAVDVGRDLAPEVPGGPELGPAVVEPEVDGRRRLAREDERVGARGAHLGGEEAAALAVADGAGERRARAGGHAALPGDGQARERAHGHHEHVVGAERIGARRHGLQQEVRRERAPAGVRAVDVLGHGPGLDGAAGQVHVIDGRRECHARSPLPPAARTGTAASSPWDTRGRPRLPR